MVSLFKREPKPVLPKDKSLGEMEWGDGLVEEGMEVEGMEGMGEGAGGGGGGEGVEEG